MGTAATVFLYTATELMQIELLLSKDRLTPYTRPTLHDTIKDYERNTVLCEGLYGVLQGAEIAIRNAVHNVMSHGLSRPDWYDHIPWDSPEADSISRAKDKLIRGRRVPTPGRVIAELTFGFWVQTTARKYEKVLWVPYVHKAFPAITTDRRGLSERLNRIRDLRNRIAHHERILHYDLKLEHTRIIETVSWVCPTTARWIDSHNRLKKCLWPLP